MALQRFEIGKGIYFNGIKSEKFKSNRLSVRFSMPLLKETAAKNALLTDVLERGTEKYPDMLALARRKQALYDLDIWGRNSKYGESVSVGITVGILDNAYLIDDTDIVGGALELLSQLLFKPVTENGVFKKEYVESEKEKLLDEIKAQINNKNQYTVKRCTEEMCAGEAYGVSTLGKAEDVEKICPACLWAQYKEMLAHAPVEIFAVGNFDFPALAEAFRQMFAVVERKEIYSLATDVRREAGETRIFREYQSVTQGKLAMGFRLGSCTGDGDFHITSVMASVLGGSPTSKLFMNVRERLSLCYYCHAIPDSVKGTMIITSGVEEANFEKAQAEILTQLEEIKKGNVTESELKSAKLDIINKIRRGEDSAGAIEDWYYSRIREGKIFDRDEYIKKLETVTVGQIAERAKRVVPDLFYFLCSDASSDSSKKENL